MLGITNRILGLTISYIVSLRPSLQNVEAFFDIFERLHKHSPTRDKARQMSGDDDRPVSSIRTVTFYIKLIRIIVVVEDQ